MRTMRSYYELYLQSWPFRTSAKASGVLSQSKHVATPLGGMSQSPNKQILTFSHDVYWDPRLPSKAASRELRHPTGLMVSVIGAEPSQASIDHEPFASHGITCTREFYVV